MQQFNIDLSIFI